MLEMEAEYLSVLGRILAEARKVKNIKQKELAEAVGIGASTWSKIENGESGLSVEQLRAACSALETHPSTVLALVEEAIATLPEKGIVVPAPRTKARDEGAGREDRGTIEATATTAMVGAAVGGAAIGATGITTLGIAGGFGVGLGMAGGPLVLTGAVLGKVIASVVSVSALWATRNK